MSGEVFGISFTEVYGVLLGNSLVTTNTTLTATMADSADPAAGGSNFTYTVQVNNTGGIAATSLSATITLDAGVTWVSTTGTGWTLGHSGQTVTATLAALVPGPATPVVITVTSANATRLDSSSLALTCANAATVNVTQTTQVNAQTTNTVTITDSADPTPETGNFTYTVQVTNTGSFTGTTYSLDVTLDSSLTWVSTTGTGWTLGHSGQHVTATLSSLVVGAANPIVITVTAGSGAITASTSSTLTCANAPTVNTTETTAIHATTITGTLVDTVDPVLTSGAYAYTLDLNNTGDVSALAVSAVITLPTGSSYVSSSGTGWTLGVVGLVVTATRALMATGAAPTITVNLTAPTTSLGSTTITCTAAITASDVTGTLNKSENTVLNPNATKDATSGVYLPQSATEWATFPRTLAALYLDQEASGTLADTLGGTALAIGGTHTYANAMTGWTAKTINCADGSFSRFTLPLGTGANPSTTSVARCSLMAFTSSGSARRVLTSSNDATHPLYLEMTSAGKLTINCDGVSTTGTSVYTDGLIHGICLMYDRTNGAVKCITDLETFSGTYSAGVIEAVKGFQGATGSTATPTMKMLYSFVLSGANAEGLSKTLWSQLGLTVGY